jgi:uncharacterized protein involved in outer membrane biogenesis
MRIAAWIAAGVVAVLLAAVFLAPVLIDWDGFKPRIAEAVSDATGKELRIDGPLAVSLFPAIEVSATGIHLRDSVSNTEVVAIGRVAAKVRLWPLLTKRLVIDSFVISEPELNLLIDADGRPNWAIAPAAAPEPAEVAPSQDREPPLRDVFFWPTSGSRVAGCPTPTRAAAKPWWPKTSPWRRPCPNRAAGCRWRAN